jgi:hypothetical protein
LKTVRNRISEPMSRALLLCALLSCATGFGVGPAPTRTPVDATRHRPVALFERKASGSAGKLDEARAKLVKGGLPQKFADRVSFQTGGSKQVGQEEEILVLWNEFKRCYPNQAVAQDMLSKNTAVILPSLNSPRKIKGTYAQLNKRFGKKVASEILLKNPGVLVCSPESLAKESDESILKAADLVDSLEANKETINAVAGVFFLSIIGSVAYRIGTVGATPPGL